MFWVGSPCCLGLNSGRSVSINVSRTRKHFSRSPGSQMFPQCFPVSLTENKVSTVSFCFQDYAYATRHLNENPSMRALAKILGARASKHSSKFCEQFEQRPNFASTIKLDGAIRYPSQTHPKWLSNHSVRKTMVITARCGPNLTCTHP